MRDTSHSYKAPVSFGFSELAAANEVLLSLGCVRQQVFMIVSLSTHVPQESGVVQA